MLQRFALWVGKKLQFLSVFPLHLAYNTVCGHPISNVDYKQRFFRFSLKALSTYLRFFAAFAGSEKKKKKNHSL